MHQPSQTHDHARGSAAEPDLGAPAAASWITPEDIAALRPALLRFARRRAHDALAEDLVSETLLALLERPAAFRADSSVLSYAIGILKFKLIDSRRRDRREVPIESALGESPEQALDALLRHRSWSPDQPTPWPRPEQVVEQMQQLRLLQREVDRLSAKHRRVFLLREGLDRDIPEICAEMGITANHCGVLLHRARAALRRAMAAHAPSAGVVPQRVVAGSKPSPARMSARCAASTSP